MSTGDRKLDELLVDEEQLNEELLVETLSPLLGIGNDSGNLVLKPAFHDLDSKEGVAVVLLAQKARHELDMAESDSLTPTEISELSGIKRGTVYPVVRDLDENGLVEANDGEYRIPTYNIERAKQFVEG